MFMDGDIEIISPHIFYQILITVTHTLFPFVSAELAGFYILPALFYTLLCLSINFFLDQFAKPLKSFIDIGKRLFFVFSLSVFSPITLTTFPDVYFGYIYANVYHNPTINLIKPFSIILFFLSAFILNSRRPTTSDLWLGNRSLSLLILGLTIVSLISKPSYMICFLPATAVVLLYRAFQVRGFAQKIWLVKPWIFWLFLPSLIILIGQYSITYGVQSSHNSGIVFSPFSLVGHYLGFQYLLIIRQFILSILFPIVIYFVYFNKAVQCFRLNYAWLVFSISAFYYYFLAESGERFPHGNFAWGAQIGVLILFIESAVLLIRSQPLARFSFPSIESEVWKYYICLSVYLLHVLCGLMFLFIFRAPYFLSKSPDLKCTI